MKSNDKIVVSEELKIRLVAAAENGSVIAADILKELKKNKASEVFYGHTNYFASKRLTGSFNDNCKRLSIAITYCKKDLTNPEFPGFGDPSAPNRRENREQCTPNTFISMFKNLKEYRSIDISYFSEALCCSTKVKIKLESSMEAIEYAYAEENYSPYCLQGSSPLHSSCMRHGRVSGVAADFYHNFAGAKILVAYGENNCVLGRAIVWNGVRMDFAGDEIENLSVMDRVYYSFEFVRILMLEKAKELNINLRKRYNSCGYPRQFIVVTAFSHGAYEFSEGSEIDAELSVYVPKIKWHKRGAPYLDTFYILTTNNNKLALTNVLGGNMLAVLQTTDGVATKKNKLCPICGGIHDGCISEFCNSCYSTVVKETQFGSFCISPMKKYKGECVPAVLLTDAGKPTQSYAKYLAVSKLFN